jgi:hypothetical protein
MNVIDFIFQLLHIRNLLTLFVLTPLHSPYTPFVDYAHLYANYENTFNDCINFSIDYALNSNDYVNTLDDRVNIAVNLANIPNISSLNFCIPNPTLMQLLLFCKLKIKIVFIIRFVIYFYLHHSSFVVSIFDILYHLSLCQNLFPKLHLFLVPNILTFVVFF